MRVTRTFFLPALAASVILTGCDLAQFAANSTAGVFERGSVAFNQHWDYELAGDAAPAGIMQLEGLHRVTPDNDKILLSLARSYVGYSYGYVEDQIELLDEGDFDEETRLQTRARYLYLRGHYFAIRYLNNCHSGYAEAKQAGLEEFKRWLAQNFTSKDDAPALFWAGYTLGSAINVSRDDPNMIADLSFARAMMERQVELDPEYYNGGGVTFLAVVNAGFSEAMGGNPERGRELFEQSLQITNRTFLLTQYNYAKTYAVQTQNRELFEQLLREVIDAGDISHENRLPNKIAQRRARRLLAQADELFF
jgi:hypothetical protein